MHYQTVYPIAIKLCIILYTKLVDVVQSTYRSANTGKCVSAIISAIHYIYYILNLNNN